MQGYIPLNIIEAIDAERRPKRHISVEVGHSPLREQRRIRFRIARLLVRIGRWLEGTGQGAPATSAA